MSEDERAGAAGKKPYVRPTVEVYGSLSHLTATVGMTGNPDGGHTLEDSTSV